MNQFWGYRLKLCLIITLHWKFNRNLGKFVSLNFSLVLSMCGCIWLMSRSSSNIALASQFRLELSTCGCSCPCDTKFQSFSVKKRAFMLLCSTTIVTRFALVLWNSSMGFFRLQTSYSKIYQNKLVFEDLLS